VTRSAAGLFAGNAQRARTADRILEQFEREELANFQIAEPRALAQVAPVKEHTAAIGEADEAVPLPEHQRDDAT
jgi:hypothetical protein